MKIVGLILGGGAGTRLQPLTRERSKPAVPVAGKFRLVDIPISNCINSGIRNIFVLTQYNSVSLHQHIASTYRFDQFSNGYVRILAAEQTPDSDHWFQGTADAVRRSIRYFQDDKPDLVVILSGDQLYRMDIQDVIKSHLENGADITVCTKPVKREEASSLGIMKIDDKGKIISFYEKPSDSKELDSLISEYTNEKVFLASMGIYIFNIDILNNLLQENDKKDFGKDIIPEAIKSHDVYSYIFNDYWEDIGTIQSFWAANLALTDDVPKFSFYDMSRLIFTRLRYLPPSKINSCELVNSLISDGCILSGKRIERSVIGLRSIVGEGSIIEESILMGSDFYDNNDLSKPEILLGVGSNCIIKKAIIDKNVRIGDNVEITPENKPKHMDSEKFCIRDGIIIIPKNTVISSNTKI